jgi:hypothetical protein
MMELYVQSPIRLHKVVFISLSTLETSRFTGKENRENKFYVRKARER